MCVYVFVSSFSSVDARVYLSFGLPASTLFFFFSKLNLFNPRLSGSEIGTVMRVCVCD